MAHRQQDLHQQAKPLTTATSLSWPLSILSAFLTGIVGMLAAGFVAAACVDWYGVSSREGESGYFVIAIAFLGLIAGVRHRADHRTRRCRPAPTPASSRRSAGRSRWSPASRSWAGRTARLLADIPPEIDGEALMLAVEVRWPEGQVERPVAGRGRGIARRCTPFPSTPTRCARRRTARSGCEDAHRVDGRWVVPGAVSIFTSRGKRVLVVSTERRRPEGERGIPGAAPGAAGQAQYLEWSEWLPRTRPGTTPHNRLTYRFRVQRTSQPVRTRAHRRLGGRNGRRAASTGRR